MTAADLVLALETSCDDTCAAVVRGDGAMLSNAISSQGVHDRFGGVVPEIAARQHVENVNLVLDQALADAGVALDDISLVAATQGPGLVGALLIGMATAKAVAAARRLPFAAVDHLQGHVAANFLAPIDLQPPFVCLIASGGHTLLTHVRDRSSFQVLGRTLDDAAGEAFDKGARMLGLGFPGGPALERLAREGDPDAFDFPVYDGGLDFSFSGLKTSLLYRIRDLGDDAERHRADLASSYQRAIVTALVDRVERALMATGAPRLALGGGVAANGAVRARMGELGVPLSVPERSLCTDNAAMIASAARYEPSLAYPDYLGLDVYATGERAR